MSLQQQIEDYIKTVDADFGIHIKNLRTNEEVNINSDRLFQMASVFKVPILATLYDLVHQGKIDDTKRIKFSEDDLVPGSGVIQELAPGVELTIRDIATLMIIVSDNLATDKILELIGVDTVENKMREVGIENIHIAHPCWDLLRLVAGVSERPQNRQSYNEIVDAFKTNETDPIIFSEEVKNNLSTPRDMSALVEKIAKNEFVSQAVCEDIRDIMHRQQYKQRIGGLLPPHTEVASKTGSIATMFNDTGIVYLPDGKGEYVMTAFTAGNQEGYQGNEPIAKISRMAYDSFVK